ncbi:MAG TPA: phosphosulfolactate synthase [Clostridia bacterium]|nr:phosphosulfolactate synthase [Clostridia bacterium]
MNCWRDLLEMPMPGRLAKPRHTGLTMVIDKGLGLTELQELLASAAGYIDMIKLGFGTSLLYPDQILRAKIAAIRQAGILVFPGGTFFEIAYLQKKIPDYCRLLVKYGFTAIEISDGTVELPPAERRRAIKIARETGLSVITEIGKKDPRDRVSMSVLREQMEEDLAAGAYKVIVEGRESGKGVMLYDQQGELKQDELEMLLQSRLSADQIIWEAPLKTQQQKLISLFGCNVNLGNIAPQEVLALEALRLGLRGDTLRSLLTRSTSIIPLSFAPPPQEDNAESRDEQCLAKYLSS